MQGGRTRVMKAAVAVKADRRLTPASAAARVLKAHGIKDRERTDREIKVHAARDVVMARVLTVRVAMAIVRKDRVEKFAAMVSARVVRRRMARGPAVLAMASAAEISAPMATVDVVPAPKAPGAMVRLLRVATTTRRGGKDRRPAIVRRHRGTAGITVRLRDVATIDLRSAARVRTSDATAGGRRGKMDSVAGMVVSAAR